MLRRRGLVYGDSEWLGLLAIAHSTTPFVTVKDSQDSYANVDIGTALAGDGYGCSWSPIVE